MRGPGVWHPVTDLGEGAATARHRQPPGTAGLHHAAAVPRGARPCAPPRWAAARSRGVHGTASAPQTWWGRRPTGRGALPRPSWGPREPGGALGGRVFPPLARPSVRSRAGAPASTACPRREAGGMGWHPAGAAPPTPHHGRAGLVGGPGRLPRAQRGVDRWRCLRPFLERQGQRPGRVVGYRSRIRIMSEWRLSASSQAVFSSRAPHQCPASPAGRRRGRP